MAKLLVHSEKKIKKITETKQGKLEKLTNNDYLRKLVSKIFNEHLDLFTFRKDFSNCFENVCPDVTNVVNLVTLTYLTRSLLEASYYNNSIVDDKEEGNLILDSNI